MKCIDEELIQKYIDGETDFRETEQIEKHIAICSQCANNIEERKVLANAIKFEFQKLDSRLVAIPEFTIPATRKHRLNANLKHLVYIISAACVAACLFFFLHPQKQAEEDRNNFLMYSVIKDFDANRTFSEQETTFLMIDSDGKIIEIIN
jgi:hypothetical protein